MVDIAAIKLIDLLPPSIRDDPKVRSAATALDGELQTVTAVIPLTLLISRIDELAEDVIDSLAWQWHVDFYEPGINLKQKRNLVKTAIEAHRRKGTPYAVELVVKAILEDAIVQEWWEYGGEPYYFRVVRIGGEMIEPSMYDRLEKAIRTVKNTRSWLEGVSLFRQMSGTLYLVTAQSVHKRIDIYPAAFHISDVSATQYLGGSVSAHKRMELGS